MELARKYEIFAYSIGYQSNVWKAHLVVVDSHIVKRCDHC
jgi:hypothetical protein